MPLKDLEELIDRTRRVDGRWRLSANQELEFRRSGRQEQLLLRARLIAAEPDALVVQVTERFTDGGFSSRLVRLSGRWEADDRNRLLFAAQREYGAADRITLEGGWELADDQQLIYRFSRGTRRGKPVDSTLLRFQGYWEIQPDLRLAYVLDRDSDSVFRFRSALQSPLVLPKQGALRFQIGVEGRRGPRTNTVTLFGKWRVSRDFGLEFEAERPGSSNRLIRFGASYRIGARGEIVADLVAPNGRPTGMEVVVTRLLLRSQAETFLALRRTAEEASVQAGVRLRW